MTSDALVMGDIGKADGETRFTSAPDAAALEDMWNVDKITTSWDRLVTGQSTGTLPGWERLITGQDIDEELLAPLGDNPQFSLANGGRLGDDSLLPSLCSATRSLDLNEGTLSSMMSAIFADSNSNYSTKATSMASSSHASDMRFLPQEPRTVGEDPLGNFGSSSWSDMLAACASTSSTGGAPMASQHGHVFALGTGPYGATTSAPSYVRPGAPTNEYMERESEDPGRDQFDPKQDPHMSGMWAYDPEWATVHTVMVRNLPNKYTQQTLVEELHNAQFQGTFDFLYLPIDAERRSNKGYAFINFTHPSFAWAFRVAFDGRKMILYTSKKEITVKPAVLQGFEANYWHYSAARVSQGDPSARPLFLRSPDTSIENVVTGPPRRHRRRGGGSAIDQAARRAAAAANEQIAEKATASSLAPAAEADTETATKTAPSLAPASVPGSLCQKQILLAPLLQESGSDEMPMWLDVPRAAEAKAPATKCMQKVFCPYCGTKGHVGAKFCSECGADVRT